MIKLIQLIIECQAVSETASLNSDTIRNISLLTELVKLNLK